MAYNAKTACKLTGITYRQLVYWDNTHLIKPSISEAEGTGTVRLYSFTDLVELKVARMLKAPTEDSEGGNMAQEELS